MAVRVDLPIRATATESRETRVLLWINGAFGVGKTQTAHEIAARLPGSTIADPNASSVQSLSRNLQGISCSLS